LNIIHIAEYIGIVAFALSGFFVAIKERLDLLGIFISSFLTALGGGVLRDVIIQKPPLAFSSNLAPSLVIATLVVAILFKLHQKGSVENKEFFIFSDTLGLVSFAISGALMALKANFTLLGVVLIALISAVGGGVMRDILINRVPILLKSDFYGSVAMIVGFALVILSYLNLLNIYSLTTIFLIGVVFRIVAYKKRWKLPVLH